jgi:two-component system CheB/CheR fusion protein
MAYTCYRVANLNSPGGTPPGRNAWLGDRLSGSRGEAEEYLKIVLDDYEAAIEELKATQEELTCANEELQVLNQELLTANEDLKRLNSQLRDKNRELESHRHEVAAMLRSAGLAILVVGTDLRIRRFTPLAEELFRLREADLGRPVREMVPPPEAVPLESACLEVLADLQPQRRMVSDFMGRRRSLSLRPYRTTDHRIDGVVISVLETT